MRKISTILCFALTAIFLCSNMYVSSVHAQSKFIKWVDFNASYELLDMLYKLDVESWNAENGRIDGSCEVDSGSDIGQLKAIDGKNWGGVGAIDGKNGSEIGQLERKSGSETTVEGKGVRLNFVEMLSYVAYKNGNNFSYKNDVKIVNRLVSQLKQGKTIAELTGGNEYFQYFMTAYGTIFKEFFGVSKNYLGEQVYGLTAYSPIAKGFWYNDYDDFGNSRSFGFKRRHLGHDMMGSVGTPIVAVEGGEIAELGWNMYGGWRVGVRSHDGGRYYYYAHLRKDKPFAPNLKKGDTVIAGQVIGYLGVTGYSNTENTNMRTKPHLHFGMQLIFDESQVSGNSEIWIDVYAIVQLLAKNRASAG